MTEELTKRAWLAVADLESVATYWRSPHLEAAIEAAVRSAVLQSQSPWVDRAGAAARWRCSVDEIDRAAKAGVLVRHERHGTPLFEKVQGDDALRSGAWRLHKSVNDQAQRPEATI